MEPNTRTTILAPTVSLTEIIFNKTLQLQSQLSIKPQSLNNKEKKLLMPWQSTLNTATMKNMKQVLGVSNNLFIIDELAVSEISDLSFLAQDILPTLLENDGKLLIISTPRGFNIFYDIYKYALEDSNSNAFTYTIYDLDYISEAQIDSLKRHYEKLNLMHVFRQEFLAEFINFSGMIYSFELKTASKLPNDLEYFIGIDPGATHPFAVVLIGRDADNIYIIETYKVSNSDTKSHAEYIQSLIDKYDPTEIYIDHAAKQTSLDLAYLYDISCRNAVKAVDDGINYIRSLAGNIYLYGNHDDFVNEFNSYHMKNNNIVKRNDDLLDAFRYAVYTSYLDYYAD